MAFDNVNAGPLEGVGGQSGSVKIYQPRSFAVLSYPIDWLLLSATTDIGTPVFTGQFSTVQSVSLFLSKVTAVIPTEICLFCDCVSGWSTVRVSQNRA